MSRRSSVTSEGEIFSSDSEKANRSLHSRNGTSVDRHTRQYHTSIPRSPASQSSYHRDYSRSRSRSPYHASRGEKRRRDDRYLDDRPRNDPRRFNVRYEDDRSYRSSYRDLDPSYTSRSHLRYDDVRSSRKRPRTRSRSGSRSPFRHKRSGDDTSRDRSSKIDCSDTRRRNDPRGSEATIRPRDDHTVSEKRRSPSATRTSRANAESRRNQYGEKRAGAALRKLNKIPSSTNAAPADENQNYEPVIVDEAKEAEERRKRREALKAKYSSQATPLLVHALHAGGQTESSTPEMKAVDTPPRVVDSTPISPQSPKIPSAPESPAEFDFSKDEAFANANASPADRDGEEEPSAADYDPTLDMQEERSRHDKRLFNEDIPSSTYNDTQTAQQEVIVAPDVNESAPPKKRRADFDMFADEDEDEDDMFAPLVQKTSKASETQPKAPQTLDAGMLDNWDDPEGYYNTILGELIGQRYQVQQNLGRGMFSSVIRALDKQTTNVVAIKIIRNNDTMRKAGIKEIDILKDLNNADPEDKKHVIRMLTSFDHKSHLCMVFENLSLNLRETLKKFGRDVGINLKAIRAYSQQLFLGLSHLRKCGILHADLKPDNILINEARSTLKICDLGSASPITENPTAPYLVSRFYRAPEIILGIPYDYAIDVWSIGCTLFELYTGKILFTGRNNNGMLRSIMECRGRFPQKLLRRGTLTYLYFDEHLNFVGTEVDKLTGREVVKVVEVKAKPVRDLRSRTMPSVAGGKTGKRISEEERREAESFLELLERCLDLRPDRRITPTEALRSGFVVKGR